MTLSNLNRIKLIEWELKNLALIPGELEALESELKQLKRIELKKIIKKFNDKKVNP